MLSELQHTVETAAVEIDYLRNHLSMLEGALARGDLIVNAAFEFALSMMYVRISTVAESFHNKIIDILLSKIEEAKVPITDTRLSLLSLVLKSKICNAKGDGLVGYRLRVELLRELTESKLTAFSSSARPTDNRTIKAEHYNVLWEIFGLSGDPFPTVTDSALINEIAEYRNMLVHGRMPYAAFAKKKNKIDVLHSLDRVEGIFLHIAQTVDIYLSSENYRR